MSAPTGAAPRAAGPPAGPAGVSGRTAENLGVARDGFVVLALVCLWVLVQLVLLSGASQSRAQQVLYAGLRAELAAATAPVGGAIEPGTAVAVLAVPELELSQVVVEGTAPADLREGPGHRRDTALPGQPGVSVLYGRARTYGAPFKAVTSLPRGAEITAVTGQGTATYRVEGVRRAGDPVPAPPGQGEGRLTLVTAEGQGRLGWLGPSSVVYVDAVLVTDPFPVPPGRPASVPLSERPMGADRGALPALVLVLALLLALVAGAVLARRRFPGPLVWVVLSGPLLAVAWLATDVASRLLPNLL